MSVADLDARRGNQIKAEVDEHTVPSDPRERPVSGSTTAMSASK
ncbi:hypothetical protein JOF56_001286 [Kibdelosporangium banguiense]|uniref:Uncharacterized protein n=1 Tax=Kibdelosporangium banguiense TaxID=1365924 RepID=A0ABS4T998_9PSEU|nr:hypothetical protein [Kibdelosporangium banguiense]MBP2320901.1 hypothetical protein [Kibdelosporangium banguiense]